MIGVIDYQAGNLRSVESALKSLGIEYAVVDKPEDFSRLDRIIFPGVGQARSAMNNLQSSGLGEALVEFYRSGKPMFGICLGSQIVLESSDESDTTCLGILDGRVRHFRDLLMPAAEVSLQSGLAHDLGGFVINGERLKVPHMGWNTVTYSENLPLARSLFEGIPQGKSFYFVHSYYTEVSGSTQSICQTEYGKVFCSGLGKDNLVAVQFHPEKSGKWGLRMLVNFARFKG